MTDRIKRIISLIIVLALTAVCAVTVCSAQQSLLITVDGQLKYTSVQPYINDEGAAMAPVRFFTQGLHLPVEFDAVTGDIIIENDFKSLAISKDGVLKLNGAQAGKTFAPQVRGGYNFVPLRDICALLGYDILWRDGVINIMPTHQAESAESVSFEMADAAAKAGKSDIGSISFTPMQNPDADYIGNREKHVMAFVMGNERTKAYSGAYRQWNNTGRDSEHKPDNMYPDGKRDISSVYYPSIGLYDASDPDYNEYRMQLFKMTYIDTISLYTIPSDDWYKAALKNTIIPMMKKYGISGCLRLSSSTYRNLGDDWKDLFFDEIEEYIDLFGESNLKIDERPVFTIFDSAGLSADDLRKWKEKFAQNEKPFVMRWLINTFNADQKGAYDGMYDWVSVDSNRSGYVFPDKVKPFSHYTDANHAKYHYILDLMRAKEILDSKVSVDYYANSVSPGFDSYAVWGWGSSPAKAERGENGEVYEFKWQHAVDNQYPMVCIPTWDDWGEGSGIEPAIEYGNLYLELTRKYAAEYKGITPNDANLNLPDWIYKIRKTTSDAGINEDMNRACDLIAKEQYSAAEEIVAPYADSLNICDVNTIFDYPATETTKVDYPEEFADPKDGTVPEVNSDGSVTYYPVEDTYIRDGSSRNTNFGDLTVLTVKNSTSGMNRKIYIKFDTKDMRIENIKSAKLRLYIPSLGKDNRNLMIYETSNDWQEDTLMWQNAPAETEVFGLLDTPTTMAKKWVEADITELVKKRYGGEFSIMIINNGQSTENNQLNFASREYNGREPQLIIK